MPLFISYPSAFVPVIGQGFLSQSHPTGDSVMTNNSAELVPEFGQGQQDYHTRVSVVVAGQSAMEEAVSWENYGNSVNLSHVRVPTSQDLLRPWTGTSQSNDQMSSTKGKADEERPHHCQLCSKSFKHKPNLKVHEKSHTGERPFECSKCQKRFVRKNVLENHVRTHTGEKPYSCHQCNKRFAQAANLQHHLKVHTGEGRYVCQLCSASFRRSYQLKYHFFIHNGSQTNP